MLYGRPLATIATLSVFLWLGSVILELMSINHEIVPQVATWVTIVAATSTCCTVQIWLASQRGPRTSPARLERTTLTRVTRAAPYTGGVPMPRPNGDAQAEGESTLEWTTRRRTIRQVAFTGRAPVTERRTTLSGIPAALLGQIFRLGVEGEKNKRETP